MLCEYPEFTEEEFFNLDPAADRLHGAFRSLGCADRQNPQR